MIFDNCLNTKLMGNIGEARAVYEFVKAGLDVFMPVNEFQKADIVIKVKNKLFTVQVKTTKTKAASGNFVAQLKTTGKNSTAASISNRTDGDYDFLFILTNDENFYFMPENILPKTCITLSSLYDPYKNNLNSLIPD